MFDTSALVALLLQESGSDEIEARIETGGPFYVSAPTLLELRLVLSGRLGRDSRSDVEAVRERIGFAVVPFTEVHADVAFEAWRAYGKGCHPAKLNLGDCIAYATAKVARAELVYVGDDFAQTDLG